MIFNGAIFALFLGVLPSSTASAAAIQANGLGSNDAKIIDRNGKYVNHSTEISGDGFKVSWDWSIPDNAPIKSGDTVPVGLPDNIKLTQNLDFNIYNDAGIIVGKAEFKAGSSTGKITFNDVLASTSIDRQGTLQIYANGKKDDSSEVEEGWFVNKFGWWIDNATSKMGWAISFNPEEKDLGTVTVESGNNAGETEGTTNESSAHLLFGGSGTVNGKNPEKPEESNKPENPDVPNKPKESNKSENPTPNKADKDIKSSSNQNGKKADEKGLPQTGMNKEIFISALGGSLLVIIIFVYLFKRNKKQ